MLNVPSQWAELDSVNESKNAARGRGYLELPAFLAGLSLRVRDVLTRNQDEEENKHKSQKLNGKFGIEEKRGRERVGGLLSATSATPCHASRKIGHPGAAARHTCHIRERSPTRHFTAYFSSSDTGVGTSRPSMQGTRLTRRRGDCTDILSVQSRFKLGRTEGKKARPDRNPEGWLLLRCW